MNFGSNRYNGNDRVIIRRRIEENKLASIQSAVQKNFHLGSVAKWEHSSEKLMNQKQLQRQRNEEIKLQQLNLQIRKQKLRKLFADEEVQFRKDIDSKVETPQQRRSRLEKKAKELRAKRIKRREEFVAKQRIKQFREQCDELRLNQGKNLTMECDRVRRRQMEEKKVEREYEKIMDAKWIDTWKSEYQKKCDREENENNYKQKLNENTAKAVRAQIEAIELQKQMEKQMKLKEVQDRVNALNLAEKLKEENDMNKYKELQMKREEQIKQYSEYQHKRLMQKELEKQLDKEFIANVQSKEAEKDGQELQKKEDNKKDIEKYLEYLNLLKEQERVKESELDKLRQAELDKAWSKRQNKWDNEEAARKQLLKTVVQGRESQIAYSQAQKQKEKNKVSHDTQRVMKEIEQFNIKETQKENDRLQYNRKIQDFLRGQMNEKQEKATAEHNEQMRFTDAEEQKRYQTLMKQEMEKDKNSLAQGKSQHHYPKSTANWWTY